MFPAKNPINRPNIGEYNVFMIGDYNIIITSALTIDIIVPFAGFRLWFALWIAGELYIRSVLWRAWKG